jgi:hypothetical protein
VRSWPGADLRAVSWTGDLAVSAGDTMQGRRRPNGTLPHALSAGDYALASEDAQVVWLCSPDGVAGHVSAPLWSIKVEEDGAVTVDPSIFWDKDATPPGWHGYLECGRWRQV